jgi:hypothetical protein
MSNEKYNLDDSSIYEEYEYYKKKWDKQLEKIKKEKMDKNHI